MDKAQALQQAKEALEVYADKKNWNHLGNAVLRVWVAPDASGFERAEKALAALATVSNAQPVAISDEFIDALILAICEMPDRNSPEDFPEGMVVTPEELRQYIRRIEERFAECGESILASPAPDVRPIDMILHCPKCGRQHIDRPDLPDPYDERDPAWINPPHRSHLCRTADDGCGHIWRPADVPTNGVAAIKTKGKADSPAPDVRPSVPSDTVSKLLTMVNDLVLLWVDGEPLARVKARRELDDAILALSAQPVSVPVSDETRPGKEPEAWKRLQSLRNPYAEHATAHVWDMAIIEAMRIVLASQPAAPEQQEPVAAQPQEIDSEWRRLALQFDGHRMQAIWHLKAMLSDPQAHAAEASKFLAAGPLSGEEVLAQRIAAIAAQPSQAKPQEAGQARDWMPMETAPKDGTMLRLLVQFDENATEDSAEPCPTIGANSFVHSGEDVWQFAGWNWEQDCFDEGVGTPVGWLPLLDVQAAPAVPEPYGYAVEAVDGHVTFFKADPKGFRNKRFEGAMTVLDLFTAPAAAPSAPSVIWRCFHCDESFTDADQAALHFGPTQHHEPACQVSVEQLREMESDLRRYREEDTDLHRQIYGMQVEHYDALRREEEKGYARGLVDAAAAPSVSADALQELADQAQELDMGYGPDACPTCGKSTSVSADAKDADRLMIEAVEAFDAIAKDHADYLEIARIMRDRIDAVRLGFAAAQTSVAVSEVYREDLRAAIAAQSKDGGAGE